MRQNVNFISVFDEGCEYRLYACEIDLYSARSFSSTPTRNRAAQSRTARVWLTVALLGLGLRLRLGCSKSMSISCAIWFRAWNISSYTLGSAISWSALIPKCEAALSTCCFD